MCRPSAALGHTNLAFIIGNCIITVKATSQLKSHLATV